MRCLYVLFSCITVPERDADDNNNNCLTKLQALEHRAQVVGSYECPSAHISCIYVYFIMKGLQSINGFLTYHLNLSKTYTFAHYSYYMYIMTT